MKILEVIESRAWQNKNTGQKVSIYGALPYTTQAGKLNWELITTGWTWRLDNGTVGLGCIPAKTRSEAVERMKVFNAR